MIRLITALFLALALPAQGATLTLPSVTVQQSSPSSCPDDDGSSGASAGAANVPSALSAYASSNTIHSLGCKVAGVDYRVGVPEGASLKVPTSSNLPSACKMQSSTVVACSGSGWTFDGYDMTGKQLNASGNNVSVTNNKFVVTASCLAPMIYQPSGSVWHIEHNSVDGAGPLCAKGLTNGFNALVYNAGGTGSGVIINVRWTAISNVPEDGFNFTGSSSGTPATVHLDYNLFNAEGWAGHPDGIQLTRGAFDGSTSLHNTFIKTAATGGPSAGTQPLHIEAQLTSVVRNWVQAFNTIITPGTCNGGNNWPPSGTDASTQCMANFGLACKQDSNNTEKDVNDGYQVYGNYIDQSGMIAGLATASYACTNTSAGKPHANIDMKSGKSIPAN